jgi:Protein of unknown function DUF262
MPAALDINMADDEILEDDFDENLSDLEPIKNWSEGAVLWSTDWTAETILSQMNRKNIDLDPSFQRRSAWQDKKQSLFIESLILGLPIPQLVLADSQTKKGSYIVIDGKQRLLAIRRFASLGANEEFKPLKLTGLIERADLNKKTYEDLVSDAKFINELTTFQNSTIRTITIRNWQNERYLYDVFLRINTGSVQLSPQELRQALHPGAFSSYIQTASGDSVGLKLALNLKAPDFRMRDAEILLRYIAYKNFLRIYAGNIKLFLDEATKKLNLNWPSLSIKIADQVSEMELALLFVKDAFGEDSYLRKWNGKQFESKKNRAVFDIMLHYFSEPLLRSAFRSKTVQLVELFKDLCENDKDFYAAIEITTKSIWSNRKRFNTWGEHLSKLSGINVDHLKYPAENALG